MEIVLASQAATRVNAKKGSLENNANLVRMNNLINNLKIIDPVIHYTRIYMLMLNYKMLNTTRCMFYQMKQTTACINIL